MKTENHTPGPWRIATGDEENGYGVLGDEKPAKSTNWPGATVSDHVCIADGKANARLIAAAPDLLAALIQLLDTVSDDGTLVSDALDDARAAIAKATTG